MEKQEQILQELKQLNRNLSAFTNSKRFQKIPEAAVTLGIKEAKLRKLCDEGVIPCSLLRTANRKHYIVDVEKAREFMENGGLIPKMLRR